MLDRKTRIASAEEEMLPHVGIRKSIGLFVFIFLSVLVTHAWHRPECWNDYRGYKIITFTLLFTSYDFNYANTQRLICCCLQIYLSQASRILTFLVKYLSIMSHKTVELVTFSPSVIKFRLTI